MKRGLRGKRKGLKSYKKSVRFLGVNSAGLKSKFTSFRKVLEELKPFFNYCNLYFKLYQIPSASIRDQCRT